MTNRKEARARQRLICEQFRDLMPGFHWRVSRGYVIGTRSKGSRVPIVHVSPRRSDLVSMMFWPQAGRGGEQPAFEGSAKTSRGALGDLKRAIERRKWQCDVALIDLESGKSPSETFTNPRVLACAGCATTVVDGECAVVGGENLCEDCEPEGDNR